MKMYTVRLQIHAIQKNKSRIILAIRTTDALVARRGCYCPVSTWFDSRVVHYGI